MFYSIFEERLPNYLTKEPITKPKEYGKGRYRRNWEQKKIAFNHRVAKRRAKNKASRQARKEQRK